jgi:hypothetical protein
MVTTSFWFTISPEKVIVAALAVCMAAPKVRHASMDEISVLFTINP